MKHSFELGGGAVMEEGSDDHEAAREEIERLVEISKKNMEKWEKGGAENEGYYPHAKDIEVGLLTDEDIDFWNRVKRGEAARDEFDEYDATFYRRITEMEEGEEKERLRKTQSGFRALVSYFFEKQELEKIEQEEDSSEPKKF